MWIAQKWFQLQIRKMSLIFMASYRVFVNKILMHTLFEYVFLILMLHICVCVGVRGIRKQSFHLCACSEHSLGLRQQHCSAIFSLALWLYLCYGLHLILIRSDSTRPLTVYCSCSTSVGFSHWQLEDTFHIVLGLWS